MVYPYQNVLKMTVCVRLSGYVTQREKSYLSEKFVSSHFPSSVFAQYRPTAIRSLARRSRSPTSRARSEERREMQEVFFIHSYFIFRIRCRDIRYIMQNI